MGIIHLPDPDPDPGPLKYRTSKKADPTNKADPTKFKALPRPDQSLMFISKNKTRQKNEKHDRKKFLLSINIFFKNSILTTPYDVIAFYRN